jgi:hypothetical protein
VAGAFSGQLPILRIDQGSVHEISSLDEADFRIKDNRWVMLQGVHDRNVFNKCLEELKNGEHLIFQYYPANGSIQESVFELSEVRIVLDWLLNQPAQSE